MKYCIIFQRPAVAGPYSITGNETIWTGGTLTKTATADDRWYLYVKTYNGDDVGDDSYVGRRQYSPYYYDGTAPTVLQILKTEGPERSKILWCSPFRMPALDHQGSWKAHCIFRICHRWARRVVISFKGIYGNRDLPPPGCRQFESVWARHIKIGLADFCRPFFL